MKQISKDNNIEDLTFEFKWGQILNKIQKSFGKRPENIEAVLFLIGVRELGSGGRTFTKEEKQDLIHIALCRVLSKSGFYELSGIDSDGWPYWNKIKNLPQVTLAEQEKLIKIHIMDYFEDEGIY